jgi:hypothetical protein
MHDAKRQHYGRRRALALLGGGAAALPIFGLVSCGGDESAPRPELIKPEPDAEPSPPPTQAEMQAASSADAGTEQTAADTPQTSPEVGQGGDMPRLDENSAQARQLAYVHDASTLDPASQPRYAQGQRCANCALYQGGGDPWGACPLFQGRLVKRTGWCNGYAPGAS